MGFMRNVAIIKDPRKIYEYSICHDCPPDFFLFGISDDGLGNKGIEVQVWLDRKTETAWFLKCRKANK
jgi:hypothetical protein